MKVYCIFEVNTQTNNYRFVSGYFGDYSSADLMCQSMNNFRLPGMPVYFCVRCLEKSDFDNIGNYVPHF